MNIKTLYFAILGPLHTDKRGDSLAGRYCGFHVGTEENPERVAAGIFGTRLVQIEDQAGIHRLHCKGWGGRGVVLHEVTLDPQYHYQQRLATFRNIGKEVDRRIGVHPFHKGVVIVDIDCAPDSDSNFRARYFDDCRDMTSAIVRYRKAPGAGGNHPIDLAAFADVTEELRKDTERFALKH